MHLRWGPVGLRLATNQNRPGEATPIAVETRSSHRGLLGATRSRASSLALTVAGGPYGPNTACARANATLAAAVCRKQRCDELSDEPNPIHRDLAHLAEECM